MKKYIGILALLFVFGSAVAQKEVKEIKIKTSAICGMCKDRIEHAVKFEKGVKLASLDVESKILTVSYRTDKTSPEKLRTVVSKTGYAADDIPADKKAYDKLHACCQKPGACGAK
jgi:mercuric ion binding protein